VLPGAIPTMCYSPFTHGVIVFHGQRVIAMLGAPASCSTLFGADILRHGYVGCYMDAIRYLVYGVLILRASWRNGLNDR